MPDLSEWAGESRIQLISPDSRSVPRLEAISPGFLVIFKFSSKMMPFYTYFNIYFWENIFNAKNFFQFEVKLKVWKEHLLLYFKSYKGHSRSGGSVLGKCIYFWKVLVETSSTVYIIAAPIEVKGQKSGGSTGTN